MVVPRVPDLVCPINTSGIPSTPDPFSQVDTDGSGAISQTEFEKWYAGQQVAGAAPSTRSGAVQYHNDFPRRSQHCTDYSSSVVESDITNDGSVHACPGTTPCTRPCYYSYTRCNATTCLLGQECQFVTADGTPNSNGDFVSPNGWEAKCNPCSPGFYGGGRDQPCSACPAGKYTATSDLRGSRVTTVDQCYDCPAGRFAGPGPSEVWDGCPLCVDGKYQPDTGASSCLECDGVTDDAKTTCTSTRRIAPVELLGGLFGLQGQDCRIGNCPEYLGRINQCLCATCCREVEPRFACMTANYR